MQFTISQQLRQVRTLEGQQLFEIQAEVIDAGDLLDAGVFLMLVAVRDDPKSDTLARVATIADLHDYVMDRATALTRTPETETAFFRTSLITLRYDNLLTAVAAQDTLKSRIDELVQDWQTYLGQFVADGVIKPIEEIDHPRYNQDAFSRLVTTYTTALTTEATAKGVLDAAQVTYNAAVTAASTAQDAVTKAAAIYDACMVAKLAVDTFVTTMGTFATAATTYQGAVPAKSDPAAEAAFLTARTVANTAIASPPDCTAFCGARHDDLLDAQAAKATADTAVATARTAYMNAQAAYETAQRNTEAALAAVRALKPTFNPTTDIPA